MALPMPDSGNVVSMKDVTRDMLREAEAIDQALHGAMNRMKERLHTLELAEDEGFRQEMQQLQTDLQTGQIEDGLEPDEFAAKYGLANG